MGCGTGQLNWVDVKPFLLNHLAKLELPAYGQGKRMKIYGCKTCQMVCQNGHDVACPYDDSMESP